MADIPIEIGGLIGLGGIAVTQLANVLVSRSKAGAERISGAAAARASRDVSAIEAETAALALIRDLLEKRLDQCEAQHKAAATQLAEQGEHIHRLDRHLTLAQWHLQLMRQALVKAGLEPPEPPVDVTAARAHLFPLTEKKR